MTTNIVAFTANSVSRRHAAIAGPRDNIVSIDAWKRIARPRRTSAGVFFMTRVLCTAGDAA